MSRIASWDEAMQFLRNSQQRERVQTLDRCLRTLATCATVFIAGTIMWS